MRLAIVRQRYNPYGGAERFVASALAALGGRAELSLALITRSWEIGAQDLAVIKCDPFFLGRFARDYSFAHCVRQVLDRERFDLVQSHERIPGCDIFRAGDGVHAAWLCQRRRSQNWFSGQFANLSPWHRYTLSAERKMFADSRLRAVICISELVRENIREHYSVPDEKLHVIYNGVDLEYFHPGLADEHRISVRLRYAIPLDVPLFVFVGSGFERKGVAPLLRSFALSNCREAYLLVVGKEKNLQKYRKLAVQLGVGNRVIFTGGVQDVRPLYAAADAFVLPTLYEPLSNAVLEALACGLPCVISNQCGAAELIQTDVNGYVCDPLDVAEIADGLERVVAAAAGMRTAARYSVSHLGVAAMSDRLVELYRGLV